MNCVGCAPHPPTAAATAVVVSPILMHRYLASLGASIDTARHTRLKSRGRQRRPNRPGHYTSWLASSFTVGGTLSAYPWGRFADRFGRKPAMIVGLCSTVLFSFTFGMSTTYASAMASRFLFGLGNSMIPIGRVMAVELLGPEHAVIGMAFLPGSRAIGTIMGPLIGGLLAQPAMLYPSVFSSTGLFARYPFLLPNLAVAFVAFVSLPFVLVHLPETLVIEMRTRDERAPSSLRYVSSGSGDETDRDEESEAPIIQIGRRGSGLSCWSEDGSKSPRWRRRWRRRRRLEPRTDTSLCKPGGLLAPWRVRLVLLLQCLIAAMSVGFDQVYPLWALSSKDTGGLQWSVPKTGKVLGWAGVGMMIFQFVVYPALCRTLGIIRLLRASGVIGALVFLVIPDVQRISWSQSSSYVVGVAFTVLIGSCTSVAETAVTLASANAVPVHMRGKFGGMFAVAGSLGRVVGPTTLSNLLAWSLHPVPSSGSHGILDYHLVFVLEAALMLVVILVGRRVLTLESMTVPIEERVSTREVFTLVDSNDQVGSSACVAAQVAPAAVVKKGRRWQDLSEISSDGVP